MDAKNQQTTPNLVCCLPKGLQFFGPKLGTIHLFMTMPNLRINAHICNSCHVVYF
jgi:hypothetical protein